MRRFRIKTHSPAEFEAWLADMEQYARGAQFGGPGMLKTIASIRSMAPHDRRTQLVIEVLGWLREASELHCIHSLPRETLIFLGRDANLRGARAKCQRTYPR